MNLTPAQLRAARALLDWSRTTLGERSGVSARSIDRFESEGIRVKDSALAAIRAALESAGVEFIAANGGGPGVRLRRPRPAQQTIICAECPVQVVIYGNPSDPKADFDQVQFVRSCLHIRADPARDGPAMPADCEGLGPELAAARARYMGQPL